MKKDILKTAFSKISFTTVLMLSAIAVPFVLGKYCELNIPGAFDSGAYAYSAKHILEGAVIGVDEIPSAKIGTLLANMLGVRIFGFSDFGPKIIQGIMQAIALILLFFGIRKHFGRTAAFISTLVASIYISAPVIAKYGNVKEQYLTACIGISIGAFFLYYGGGKKFWACLSGAAMALAPGFKETGISITVAMAVFFFWAAVLRWKPFKEIIKDALLICAGIMIALLPLKIWVSIGDKPISLPYDFLKPYISKPITQLQTLLPAQPAEQTTALSENGDQQINTGGYIEGSRAIMGFKEQFPVVMRYYKALILPIFLALMSFIVAKYRATRQIFAKNKRDNIPAAEHLVFLPAVCWILDMLFVWISPRSYEEYYIPLTLSAAATGAFIVYLYMSVASQSKHKPIFAGGGLVAVIIMVAMSWNVFAGFDSTFHSGQKYPDGRREKGFAQRLKEASNRRGGKLAAWETVAKLIKENSTTDDTMYVWGWFPGMYVEAQRLSPHNRAFESEMHVRTPAQLEARMQELLESFESKKPLFIVDSRKRHFPWNRPPLEFYPSTPNGFLPNDERIVAQYERQYYDLLAESFGEDEAKRFLALADVRKYIRENYYIVSQNQYQFTRQGIYHPALGTHVVFKRKN